MKIRDIVIETPLPSDWDTSVYDKNTSFKKRVAYAKERAKKIGAGSSRIVFEIPYEGRKTVLKIAKNSKGVAQNDQEARILSDWFIKQSYSQFFVPMIDHQDVEEDPTWLHIEYASPISISEFKSHFGCTPDTLVNYTHAVLGKGRSSPDTYIKNGLIDEDNENVNDFVELVGNTDLHIHDMSRIKNWGKYNGVPVMVDVGLSTEVYDKFYAR